MTTTLATPPRTPAAIGGASRRRAGRMGTVAVLVSGLLVAGVARVWSSSLQASAASLPFKGSGQATANVGPSAGKIGGMNSFVLALILGGLRGPLVMYLWSSSEAQKNEKQLEDFDTKVDLIRQLQPEFDTVHIFQMWNKAYNISAQLASLPAKYAVILDAIDYGKSVDAERPNSLNILGSIGQVYAQKLGSSANDKEYYIRKVREETKYRPPSPNPTSGIRQKHDSILDPSDRVQQRLLAGTRARPADLPARIVFDNEHADEFKVAAAKLGLTVPADKTKSAGGGTTVTVTEADAQKLEPIFNSTDIRYVWADWNTGSELQYLQRYEPYPYGVSPIAIGYNYDKRAEVVMAETGQTPLQVSRSVVDSRPGQELRQWADEESQRGVEAEIQGVLGMQATIPNQRPKMSLPTAILPLSQKPADPALIKKALYHYRLAARLCRDSKSEYARHLSGPDTMVNQFNDYSSHLDHLTANEYISLGDYWYLKAVSTSEGPERATALRNSEANYRQAVSMYDYMNLRYYVPQQLAVSLYPPGFNRARLDELRKVNPESLADLHQRVMMAIQQSPMVDDPNISDREDFEPFRARAIARVQQILSASGTAAPRTQPAGTQPATEPTSQPTKP